jgi:hypothetical protein
MPAFIDLSFLNAIGFQFQMQTVFTKFLLDRMDLCSWFVLLVAVRMYVWTVRGVKTNGLEIDRIMF